MTAKDNVEDRIKRLTDEFENLEACRNEILILGSLDYMLMALEKSDCGELIKRVDSYCDVIERTCQDMDDIVYLDSGEIEMEFDKMQDYISADLKVLPRLDDENVELSVFF